ncbi:MAG TPA: 6,7-dimethyl-8-ribityllumazine synthase [Bryobacteraceae bacterium]|nr:6,7-dimethyl-8-ribityllumazine synthase [Bryobacteraceae bacterium]
MAQTIEGVFDARELKFAVVVARFNGFITDRLLAGALDALCRMGGSTDNVDVVKVPGAWELPTIVKALAAKGRYDAIIALGAVIRGETPHFDYVAGEATSGLARVATETGVPIAMGVLTTNTVEQAIDRAGAKSGNKGFDAAMTAIEMATLRRRLNVAG